MPHGDPTLRVGFLCARDEARRGAARELNSPSTLTFLGRRLAKQIQVVQALVERRLSDGSITYYWRVRKKDRAAGFPIHGEVLGLDYALAVDRARMLNAHYDAWRHSRGDAKDIDKGPRFGTVKWLFERYRRSPAFEPVSERSRPEYLRALARIEDIPTKAGGSVGQLPVASITARAVDKIYAALQNGPRGKRVRQANLSIDIARRAWKVVRRLYPAVMPAEREGLGLAAIEALIAGVPVVVTEEGGGLLDIVGEGDYGKVVPARHPDALADAVETFLDNPLAREAAAAAGKQWRAALDPDVVAESFERIYESVTRQVRS